MLMQKDYDYFQSKPYEKNKVKTIADLDAAMNNLKSVEAETRLKGAKRLSYHSRKELGGNCLPVREWFWKENVRTELSLICLNESHEKVLQHLFITLTFIYERYLVHPFWEAWHTKEDESAYTSWVLSVAEKSQQNSVEVKLRIARVFAFCGDSRAWDIYIEILPKKSANCDWALKDCKRYAKNSITENQRIVLIHVLEKITEKGRNDFASQAKIFLESLAI